MMQQNIITFDFESEAVRTVMLDGEIWFIGRDVCRCLGIANASDALARLPDDERRKGVGTTDPLGKNRQEAVAINEPGLYRLIFESRKPEAERFKHWVFHEVLPSIRKTGRYELDDADWDAIREKTNLVRQTRLAFGRKAAQDLWRRLGLPDVDGGAQKPPEISGMAEHVMDFLDELTEADPTAEVTSHELHTLYQRWAGRNRAPLVTGQAFGKHMVQTGRAVRRKTNGRSVYRGLRIVAEKARTYR